jgi:hypothetical protein
MRHQNELLIRALLVATVVLAVASPSGLAAPADVHVRLEGVTSTLFDRIVHTDGHDVRATSDRQARTCDGTNNGANPSPGPTATAATADALATLDQTFDGQWYPGYEDYFMRQLGPEREDNDALWWWGILVNRTFASTGGCQLRVHDGDEVLWANDAFSNRPFLWLAGSTATPTALVGAPLAVTVTSTTASTARDDTIGEPYAGAQVGAVTANGQSAAAGVADAGTSAADGSAIVTFHQAGWQRVKARAAGSPPAAIASNSVDVCVEATQGAGCAGTPPSRQPDDPPAGGTPPTTRARTRAPTPTARPTWLRRFATATLRDDRARALRRQGSWQRVRSTSAWQGTLSRASVGASVAVRLGTGRPAFLLRLTTKRAELELRAGGRAVSVSLPGSASGAVRIVQAPRLRHASDVVLRVLSGTIRLDGIGRAA